MSWREPLFLTNDDGIDAPGLQYLIQILHRRGHLGRLGSFPRAIRFGNATYIAKST